MSDDELGAGNPLIDLNSPIFKILACNNIDERQGWSQSEAIQPEGERPQL